MITIHGKKYEPVACIRGTLILEIDFTSQIGVSEMMREIQHSFSHVGFKTGNKIRLDLRKDSLKNIEPSLRDQEGTSWAMIQDEWAQHQAFNAKEGKPND